MRLHVISYAGLALVTLVSSGCRGGLGARADERATPPAAAAQKDTEVLARVDGADITRAEVDQKAAAALQRVREDEYEARKAALDEIVMERIYEREAKSRGVSREQLLKDEIDAKVPRPTPQQVSYLYEQNRSRVGNRTLAELTPEIEESLFSRARSDRAQAFQQELRQKAKVAITLVQPRNDIPIPKDAQVTGPADAKVTLVEFSDYLCPYCQHAQAIVDKVLQKNAGKVRFVHRDFLLGRPRSLAVARAALCAGDQGKFWEFRSSLLNQPGDWSDGYLGQHASALGLEAQAFTACFTSTKHDDAIQGSSRDGTNLGVNGTPTFFLNGHRLSGSRTVEQFQEAIDAEMKAGS